MRSYTARELEEETGFSRRTIAYYVQVGLLPRVGRRGPKTRYPKLVRDRLLFIRRVREAEGAGRVPATPLREIGAVFEG
ncbi:MAG: MerR family transcriptional regulator [Gemmatimonadales bacterium]|nr:MerR family transcriptional regulator [Gemmatimonadales bacterium]